MQYANGFIDLMVNKVHPKIALEMDTREILCVCVCVRACVCACVCFSVDMKP